MSKMAETGYTMFAVTLENLQQEAIKWADRILNAEGAYDLLMEELLLLPGPVIDLSYWPMFSFVVDEGQQKIHFYKREGVDLSHFTLFMTNFVRKFLPEQIVTVSVAHWADKPRADEFGGTSLIFTKDKIVQESTWDFNERKKREMKLYRGACEYGS